MTKTLKCYLRVHRRRCGLSQSELAGLLGLSVPASVSRYERGDREPDLRTALACQLILGCAVHELFPAAYAESGKEIARRAGELAQQLRSGPLTRRTKRKLAMLGSLAQNGNSPDLSI
jgi:transcriptional regulator with XRE-family HTH domain